MSHTHVKIAFILLAVVTISGCDSGVSTGALLVFIKKDDIPKMILFAVASAQMLASHGLFKW